MGTGIAFSSVIHLILSTTPFLILFSYFIYAAHERPGVLLNMQQQQEQQQQEQEEQEQEQQQNASDSSSGGDDLIPLTDMLQMMLAAMICWAWLVSYLIIFVPNRRNLMKRYKKPHHQKTQNNAKQLLHDFDEENVLEVMGDVYYDRPKGILGRIVDKVLRTDLAYVTYKYPEPEGNAAKNSNEATKLADEQHTDGGGGVVKFVEKKIRTYHPYHRENVAIWVLKGYPLSGQPKADIERDVASFQSETAMRNQKNRYNVILVAIGWMVFLLTSALYMIHQIGLVENLGIQNQEEEGEDSSLAWYYFWIYLVVILPMVAIGLNCLQWTLHFWWVTQAGKVTETPTKVVPKSVHGDDLDVVDSRGYVAMF